MSGPSTAGQQEPDGRKGRRAGLAAMAGGLLVLGLSIGLMLGKVGATTTVSTKPASAVEQPSVFLDELATALRQENVAFLLDRLDPAVIGRFGVAACRTHLAALADPTAAFQVLSVGPPSLYAFRTGTQRTDVAATLPVAVRSTQRGVIRRETVHLALRPSGDLAWFTDCS
jgi:hypothetical protein